MVDIDHSAEDLPEWLPTVAWPGSPAKIEVLRRRVEAGFPLWHPEDITELESWREWYFAEGTAGVAFRDSRQGHHAPREKQPE